MINLEQLKLVMEAGIPLEDYENAASQAQDFDFEESGDPAKDFKAMIILLNDNAALQGDLKDYCDRYDIEYNQPDVDLIFPG